MERYESEEGRRSKVAGGWWTIRCRGGRRCRVGKSAGLVESRRRRGRRAPPRAADACCREKLRGPGPSLTVPQSDTGGRGEQPQGLEGFTEKELGKMNP